MAEVDSGQLLTALRDAARELTRDNSTARDRDSTLHELVHAAVTTIARATGGGISRTESGTVDSAYATSSDIGELDRLQSELGEGPCITAAQDPPSSGIVLADDLAGVDQARWPSFAAAAARAGYRSIVSVQLSLNGRRRSALNLYAHAPHVFDQSAQLTAGLFGAQAAVLLHGADHATHLNQALATRDVIGQAKGILMERFTVTDEQAFQTLVRASQDTNLRLVDVARWLAQDKIHAARTTGTASGPDAVTGQVEDLGTQGPGPTSTTDQ